MGIAKDQFDSILSEIFKKGNTIELYREVPDEITEQGGEKISEKAGTGSYKPYEIQTGDFTVSKGVVTSARNMMLYLCEDYNNNTGHGTAKGFGVYNGYKMLYFGKFVDGNGVEKPMEIGYNTVPTIKKYNGSDEGVHITMTSTNVSATAE